MPELVQQHIVQPRFALNSAGFNLARATGPSDEQPDRRRVRAVDSVLAGCGVIYPQHLRDLCLEAGAARALGAARADGQRESRPLCASHGTRRHCALYAVVRARSLDVPCQCEAGAAGGGCRAGAKDRCDRIWRHASQPLASARSQAQSLCHACAPGSGCRSTGGDFDHGLSWRAWWELRSDSNLSGAQLGADAGRRWLAGD